MKHPFPGRARALALAIAAATGAPLLVGCGGDTEAATTPAPSPTETAGPGVYDSQLAFDKSKYTTLTVTLDGVATPVRWYREVCYVGKPMTLAPTQPNLGPPINVDNTACGYQNLNIFVREADAGRQDNAILLNVNNAGWFASYQGGLGGWDGKTAITNANYKGAGIVNGGSYVSTSNTDKVGAALARGMVVVTMSSRSRGATAPAGAYSDGVYQGKAPAAIVDAKAAVRYLRLNDAVMFGNAKRIIVNGTSGGGAQSTQLAATGDHADYLPYLKSIGAAGVDANGKSSISDSVYAVVANRTILNGTSGGGAQSTQLAATGDQADYLPYLKSIGAAGVDANGKSSISDSVYAVVAYCPIQDMGSADIAYEWMFNVLGTRAAVSADQKAGLILDASGAELVRAANPDPAGSQELMTKFVAYQASLGLKTDTGAPLTTDNMLAALQGEIQNAAIAQVKAGGPVVAFGASGTTAANGVAGGSGTLQYKNDFIDIDASGKVSYFNMSNYLKYVAKQSRLKAMPSFDQVGQTPILATTATADTTSTGAVIYGNYHGGESNLFGNAAQVYANFTEYAWNHNNGGDAVNPRQADMGLRNTGYTWAGSPQRDFLLNQYKMIDALAYIGRTDGITRHWRIRVGARDRDTSFTVAYNISRALRADAKVKTVDYALQWDTGHAGDYDVQSAFAWIDARLAAGD